MSVYVTNPALFVRIPSNLADGSIAQLVESLKIQDLNSLLDLTYVLLTKAEHNRLNELLPIWEIRLLLLVVAGDLASAKAEAVNLNNALYLRENSMSAGAPTEPQEVYPLPKNNDGVIQYGLLKLMLRLKSAVNMSLVNEVYKLGYQIRLKNPDKLKLQNLSYHVMAILLATRSYWTLLNFARSLVFQLSQLSTNELDKLFLSHATAIEFLVQKLMGLPLSLSEEAFNNQISNQTLSSIQYVFNIDNIYAISDVKLFDVCSLLGLWELANTYEASVEDGEFVSHAPEASADFELCYQLIFPHWKEDFTRVFCFESGDSSA